MALLPRGLFRGSSGVLLDWTPARCVCKLGAEDAFLGEKVVLVLSLTPFYAGICTVQYFVSLSTINIVVNTKTQMVMN